MFVRELAPLYRELLLQPTAFFGGVCAALLHLDPEEDPLKSWLQQFEDNQSIS